MTPVTVKTFFIALVSTLFLTGCVQQTPVTPTPTVPLGIAVEFTSIPSEVDFGESASVSWKVSGNPGSISETRILFDKQPGQAVLTAYSTTTSAQTGTIPQTFTASVQPTAVGFVFMRAYAKIDGKDYFSGEEKVEVEAYEEGTEEQEEEVKTCPACLAPSDWSACENGTQARENFKCSAETNFLCQPFQETQACEEPVEPQPPIPANVEFTIEFDDAGFYPNEVQASEGDTVKITFQQRTTNIGFGGGDLISELFNSGTIPPGGTYVAQFAMPGTDVKVDNWWPNKAVYKASFFVRVK
ncbi:MAG: hypothetical protein HY393_04160 [Candidatus Diapherotrites archaeon]|nr:hypothetical protein [Candidatus Diapherotrites archaeon]